MAQQGHRYSSPPAMLEQLGAEWNAELTASFGAGTDIFASPETAKRQDAEIALAVIDFDCQTEVDYDARLSAVSRDLQEEYIRTHPAEIAELTDLVGR
ncbi:hypothetical protein [Salana multivorans]